MVPLISTYLSTTAIPAVQFAPYTCNSTSNPLAALRRDMVGPFDAFSWDRKGKSDTPSGSDQASTSSGPSRISLLPSVRLPSFSRQGEAPEQPPALEKPALLTLRASSRSFIDTTITDDVSKTPLYTMRTTGASTTLTRSSPTGGTMQFATVRWPKFLPTRIKGKEVSDGVEIQMGNQRYIGGETLLRPGPKANSARRFNMPNYSHSLKWKRRGDAFWCTGHNLKGPIAILEAAKDKRPMKLTIYETLRDKYDSRSVLYHQGVYILLLDYLVITSMLLLTDLQEWMLVKIYEEKSVTVPNPLGGDASSLEATASQLRKIMYREPIYPKLSGDTASNFSASDNSNSFPPTPISPTNFSHFGHGIFGGRSSSSHSQYRSSYQTTGDQSMFLPQSMLSLSSDSEDEDDGMEDAVVHTRAGSPASMNYPASLSHPPSHNYIDPSFYPGEDLPPVPPIPLRYAHSNQSLRDTSQNLSRAASPLSRELLRELPRPPSQQLHLNTSPRSESLPRGLVPFEARPQPPPKARRPSTSGDTPSVSPVAPPAASSQPQVGRTRSMTTGGQRGRTTSPRPLPSVPLPRQRPPTSSSSSSHNTISNTLRRARSHATLAEEGCPQQEPELLAPLPTFNPHHHYASPAGSHASLAPSQRSLPPTPISMDPSSPRPDILQEELRVTAATVQMLRQQSTQQQQQYHHSHHQQSHHGGHQPPTIRIPTSPLRKASHTHGGIGRDEEDEENGQWVQVLSSPSGRTLPPLPAAFYDVPPPAYNESEAMYGNVKPDGMAAP
ncbi:hypothetical protein DFP72DRAFT_1060478 [Ephemerocybe angulata]|uniref:Uncharacterized protein n=1 Tax=Ephemerocybe angulata TaxID=980116 RepID=A0A8H6IGA5_9AGAR|nr:hypothetical protein DFP72DRAFT_1060478 [Tulosesus angulatus]